MCKAIFKTQILEMIHIKQHRQDAQTEEFVTIKEICIIIRDYDYRVWHLSDTIATRLDFSFFSFI